MTKSGAARPIVCLLYTSDAADERSSVDLGGRRIIKKKKKRNVSENESIQPDEKRRQRTRRTSKSNETQMEKRKDK